MPDSKPDRETRIRERAYKLWEENGRPDGRDADLWQQAEDLIAMEDNPDAGQCPSVSVSTPRSQRSRRELRRDAGPAH